MADSDDVGFLFFSFYFFLSFLFPVRSSKSTEKSGVPDAFMLHIWKLMLVSK